MSGAARIQNSQFRDELIAGVPRGDAAIVGGEMEGVGLLSASTASGDPTWCIVKGISDFADGSEPHRETACRNAADFVLSALVNDARGE